MQKRFLIWDNPKDAVLTLTFLLMTIGCINVYSASFVDSGSSYLYNYLIYGALSLIMMYVLGWHTSYKSFLQGRQVFYVICLVSLLAVLLGGVEVNGSRRWLSLGGIRLQPSEFAKAALIILGAGSLGELLKKGQRATLLHFPECLPMLQALLLMFLVFKQPNMGTAAILAALMLIMYFLAGLPLLELLVLVGGGIAGLVAMAVHAPYRLARIQLWLDPWQDADNIGYQMVQSLMSIGSGGWLGDKVGIGTTRILHLPEAHTDFAFAIFCQEWGFVGALLLIGFFLLLALAIQTIAFRCKNTSAFLLVTGINVLIVGQSLANMAMVTGILPVIGVPMAFISYGGTSLLATLGAIGLIISVYRTEIKASGEQEQARADFALKKQELAARRAQARRWRP
ncbi:MAG: FtsW/RodA/SpoVE family cell cycle protein [Acidaminococcaceae bacterium]